MKQLRWQLAILVMAFIAIGILLFSQQPALQETASLQPVSGGIYTEALVGSFGRLNPVLDYYNQADRDVDRLLYSGLVRFDASGIPEGDLAESWGISADGKTYNFSIRAGANWHDGEPVTSDDVIFTIDLLRSDSAPLPADIKEMWKLVQVTPLDAKTLQFRLPEPYAPFLDYLTFGLLPKHLLGGVPAEGLADHPYNLSPVGCGPFRFNKLESLDGRVTTVILDAFEEYSLGRPYLDQVVFRYYPDASTALAAYRAGEAQGIAPVTREILPEVLSEPGLNLYTARKPSLTLLYLNLDDPALPFFQDGVIRKALLTGLNRQWMIDRLLGGQAILADGPVFPGTWAYYEQTERIPFDREAALAVIKEAGYTIPAEGGNVRSKDGVALSFQLLHPDGPGFAELAEAIRKDWEMLGVEAKPQAAPYDQLLSQHLEPHAYQAALVELDFSRSPDPDPYPFWDQAQISGGQNYAQWNDRSASEYLENARVTFDINERAKFYRNFQVRFAMELPALPLFYPVYSYAVNEELRNVSIGPLFDPSDRFYAISSWYLLTRVQQITPTP